MTVSWYSWAGGMIVAPVEVGGDHHRVHGVLRGVLRVALRGILEVVAVQRGVIAGHPGDRLRVGVQQQLRGVTAVAGGGVVGAVHPVSVALTGLHRGQVDVPHIGVHLGDLDAPLVAVLPDQAQLDALGHLREQGEVGARAVEGGTQGVGLSGPDLHGPRVDAPCQRGDRRDSGHDEGPLGIPRGPSVVGDTGFEPVTSSVSGKRATAAPIARRVRGRGGGVERTTGFEPATLTLAR